MGILYRGTTFDGLESFTGRPKEGTGHYEQHSKGPLWFIPYARFTTRLDSALCYATQYSRLYRDSAVIIALKLPLKYSPQEIVDGAPNTYRKDYVVRGPFELSDLDIYVEGTNIDDLAKIDFDFVAGVKETESEKLNRINCILNRFSSYSNNI
jgi:hypothetical protein